MVESQARTAVARRERTDVTPLLTALAWSVGALSIAAFAGAWVVAIGNQDVFDISAGFSPDRFMVAYPVAGALLASRRRSNPIGWFLLGVGMVTAARALAGEYALHALAVPPYPRLAVWAAWFVGWSLTLLFPGGLLTFLLGTAAAAVAVIVGSGISRASGTYVLPVGWPTEARVILGTGAMLAVASLLALSIGTVLRRSVAAVAAVIVAIVLPYVLGVSGILPASAAEWILRVTPAAGFAIEQSVPQYQQVVGHYGPPDYFPLAPWSGFAVLCVYAAVALGVAAWLLRRRDAGGAA